MKTPLQQPSELKQPHQLSRIAFRASEMLQFLSSLFNKYQQMVFCPGGLRKWPWFKLVNYDIWCRDSCICALTAAFHMATCTYMRIYFETILVTSEINFFPKQQKKHGDTDTGFHRGHDEAHSEGYWRSRSSTAAVGWPWGGALSDGVDGAEKNGGGEGKGWWKDAKLVVVVWLLWFFVVFSAPSFWLKGKFKPRTERCGWSICDIGKV